MAGAWFVSRNYLTLSLSSYARRCLIVGVLVVVGLLPVLWVLPAKFPNYVIPLAYSAAFFYFAKGQFMTEAVGDTEFAAGWKHWLKLVGVSVLWLLATMAFWVATWMPIAAMFPSLQPK
jgi:hypothetical protein